MNKKEALFLIDSYALIYRSYFAFLTRPLRNSRGKNVSALFGFFRNLTSLLNDGAPSADGSKIKPLCMAAVFDSRVPTFRHERYSEYKANREKAPEDLHEQVPLVEEALDKLGLPRLRLDRWEADDIIATLVARCKAEGRDCYILSGDKDLLQLVGDGTWVLQPNKNADKDSAWELVDNAAIREKWGVDSSSILDLLSLTGDKSDNIPGVSGIGEKTAAKLLQRYGSLESIYENIAGIEGAVGKKLAADREAAWFSRSLIELDSQAPISLDCVEELAIDSLRREDCASFLLEHGLRQIAEALSPGILKSPAAQQTGPAASSKATSPANNTNTSNPASTEAILPPLPPVAVQAGKKGSYKTICNPDELEKVLDEGRRRGFIALDFETSDLEAWNTRPLGFSVCVKEGEAFYIPLVPHQAKSGELSLEDGPYMVETRAKELLQTVLSDPTVCVAAHNAKFDIQVSRTWGLDRWQCTLWDTLIAAWLLDGERSRHALGILSREYLGLEGLEYKDIVPKNGTIADVPLDIATRYAGEDADYCFRLKSLLEDSLKKAELLSLFTDLEMPLVPVLAEMERAGILLHSEDLRRYGKELDIQLTSIEKDIWAMVGHEFNIASTKQLQEVLFVERGLKTGKKTKSGYSTDISVLEELARQDPVPAYILRYRQLAKLKSTYIDSLIEQTGEDGKVHTSFVQTGTATGRLSSKDPNLQNIPIRDEEGRRIRSAFYAADSMTLISADYSQIELVVLAHLSGDEGLKSAFLEGKDIHARTAALIFGIAEEAVSPEQRRIAKTINFGVMYGMSAFRLSSELNISRSDAQSFIDAYFATYSGVSTCMQEMISQTTERGYASTILGRRRYIPAIRSSNKTERAAAERVAINTPIQGSAADIVKLAMLKVDSLIPQRIPGARLLLQVHDELILECPSEHAKECAALVQELMEGAIQLSIPLRAKVEYGQNWGEFH